MVDGRIEARCSADTPHITNDMKVTSVQFHEDHRTFAVTFDDDISVILDDELQYNNTLSMGLSSSYMLTGRWPSTNNLLKRVELGSQWINKNKNRYKKWPDQQKHDIIQE